MYETCVKCYKYGNLFIRDKTFRPTTRCCRVWFSTFSNLTLLTAMSRQLQVRPTATSQPLTTGVRSSLIATRPISTLASGSRTVVPISAARPLTMITDLGSRISTATLSRPISASQTRTVEVIQSAPAELGLKTSWIDSRKGTQLLMDEHHFKYRVCRDNVAGDKTWFRCVKK